jgi:hypothetical protein
MYKKSTSKRESIIKTNLLNSFSNIKLKKKDRWSLIYYLTDLKGCIRLKVYNVIDIKDLSLSIEIIKSY